MTINRLKGNGRRILVIEDDLAIRVLLRAVLLRMDFVVELAEDGLAGLEKTRSSERFDLIVLDLMMPRLDGYGFIDEMTRTCGKDRPHIVVLTAAGKAGMERIRKAAVCDAILKPFDLDAFIEVIGECLEQTHETSTPLTIADQL